MGFFSRVENRVEDTVEGAANRLANAPISPVQIAKKCEKQMKRSKMVGAGKQIAPTLFTVLVNPGDDSRLFGYYPTLAGETETYLSARAADMGLSMDGKPLVRFISDEQLKHGKFDVIAECVAAPIIDRLREEELEYYGISTRRSRGRMVAQPQRPAPRAAAPAQPAPNEYLGDDEYDDDFSGFDSLNENYEDFSENLDGFDTPALDPFSAEAAMAPAAETTAGARMSLPHAQPLLANLHERSSNKNYKLSASNVKVGREVDNDIVVPDMGASRYHAEIHRGQTSWVLEDCNSTNGTLVNGREISTHSLRNGDVITIGTTEYEFTQE